MKKVTLSASVEAVCPTGPYQNQRFAFGISEEIEVSDDKDLREKHEAMGSKCYDLFKTFEQRAVEERISLERKDFRFYKLATGELVPSVTTFLNYDADFFMSAELLQEYASQGNIIDAIGKHFYIKGKHVTDLKELINTYPELWTDYVIVKKGTLAFDPTNWNIPAFHEKHPFKMHSVGAKVLNEKDRYGGTMDMDGEYEGKLTIADFKRTPDKVKNLCQLACYAKASNKEYKQMMIIPAYPDNQQGFSKPIISDEIDKFYTIAMTKREGFKKRYGL